MAWRAKKGIEAAMPPAAVTPGSTQNLLNASSIGFGRKENTHGLHHTMTARRNNLKNDAFIDVGLE